MIFQKTNVSANEIDSSSLRTRGAKHAASHSPILWMWVSLLIFCGLSGFVAPLVLSLCCGISPSNVSRFVVSVGIDAVDSEAFRASSDMGKEAGKVIEPFFAHNNSSASVVFEVFVVGIIATGFDGTPTRILACGESTWIVSVFRQSDRGLFSTEASAAFTHSAAKIACLHDSSIAAITKAFPRHLKGRQSSAEFQNCPSSKSSAC